MEELHRLVKTSVVEAEDPAEKALGAEAPLEAINASDGFGSRLDIVPLKDGFKLVFGAELFFPPSEAGIREEMKPVLERIARFLRLTSYQVYIDGHTDSVPPGGGPYPSNEALSRARALSVVRYLIRQGGVPPSAVAAIGLGSIRPRASNDDRAGRGLNRRVEIICKNKRYF